MEKEGEIVIYQAPDNPSQIEVRMEGDTIWLTQKQMAELFDTTPQNITIHLKNIFEEAELSENSTCKDFLQVQMEGRRKIERKQRFYNLDAILSVGYRVSSKRGTQFRIWATQRLKEYLVAGYSVNENRLLKNYQHLGKLKDLIETIEEAQKEGRLKIEDSDILMKLISEYSKSFTLFNEIDSDSMTREGLNTNIIYEINYDDVMEVVAQFKGEIERRGETNNIFGLELENRVKSSIGAIAQTFDGKYLYPSIEEQSANLLYMIVSGHAFKDGNKRNGSLLFLWFLEKNNYRFKESGELKFNDNAIVLLSLLIAKSRGQDKDKEFYIDLIINLLKSRRDNNFKSGGDISYKKKDKNELNEIDWLITG